MTDAERKELRALARDGRSHARQRRANAIVLLGQGWICQEVAAALLLGDDIMRDWHKLYAAHGLTGLAVFDVGGSESRLTGVQESELFEWVRAIAPRTSRVIGAFIARRFGVACSHAGLIALRDFKTRAMAFLTEDAPRNWHLICDSITDNFRVIDPEDFRVLT